MKYIFFLIFLYFYGVQIFYNLDTAGSVEEEKNQLYCLNLPVVFFYKDYPQNYLTFCLWVPLALILQLLYTWMETTFNVERKKTTQFSVTF